MKKMLCLLLMIAASGCDSSRVADSGGATPETPTLKNKIVFMRFSVPAQSRLIAFDPDGLREIALTNDTLSYDCPGISPDGRQVSFIQGGAVYVMKADGTGKRLIRPLTTNENFYRCPAWSPASDKLAFIAMVPMIKQPSPGAIYLIDVASATSTTIVTGYNYSGIEWSRDGTRLLVGSNSYTDGGPYDFRVSVLTPDGALLARVVANYWNLSWAPDGTKFAYQCGTRWPQVCVANADGSNVKMLTPADTASFAPKWSPDGKLIAYTAGRMIYVMNADGSARTMVVGENGSADITWAPDSKRLAFSCPNQFGVVAGTVASDLCVMNVDGSGLIRSANLPAVVRSPSWSPL